MPQNDKQCLKIFDVAHLAIIVRSRSGVNRCRTRYCRRRVQAKARAAGGNFDSTGAARATFDSFGSASSASRRRLGSRRWLGIVVCSRVRSRWCWLRCWLWCWLERVKITKHPISICNHICTLAGKKMKEPRTQVDVIRFAGHALSSRE